MTKLVSPNELLEFSKEAMLGGREPSTEEDWILVVNCIAKNLDPQAAQPAMKVIRMIYDIPLSEKIVAEIVTFQTGATS